MIDQRIDRIADILINHCCKLQPGERVYIETSDTPSDVICSLIEKTAEAGGIPFARTTISRVGRSLCMHASIEQMKIMSRCDLELVKEAQYCISIAGSENTAEYSDVPDEKMHIFLEHWCSPGTDYRLKHTKRVSIRWPTPSMAQLAEMSTEAFEDFYFDACILDYGKMARAAEPLKERMMKSDIVSIQGPLDTDITFSIKGIPAMICAGERNLPDGEIFTAPVRDSVNGIIHFNTGTIYHGKSFDDVRLVFKGGKVVEATSSNTSALNDILDTDEGARYVGEFSFGFNPRINQVMRDFLFDEKIAGSIHLTPGQAYEEADNGNRSSIHWDMVMIQTPEFGGGKIYFDDELIRENGRFVPDYLQCLNPENLV